MVQAGLWVGFAQWKRRVWQTSQALLFCHLLLKAGEWDTLPISGESATQWLRKLLTDAPNVDDDEKEYIHQLGTHSCKTTILSWAAKKGTDLQIRKVMGYHSLGKSNSVFIYGRDNVSPALREIEEIINMIKSGRFEPDNTRSGYFKPSGDKNENEAADPSLEDLRGASSSEDSADEDQIDHQEEELVERKVIGKWTGDLDETALPQDPSRYIRHSMSRVIHLFPDESGTSFACGREASRAYHRLESIPEVLHPTCKQCFSKFSLAL